MARPDYRFCQRWRGSVAAEGYKFREMCDLLAHGKIHIEGSGSYVFFFLFLPIVLILLGSSMRRFSLQFFMYFLFARFILVVAEIWEKFLALLWLQLRLAPTGCPLGRGTWRTVGCSTVPGEGIAHIESTDPKKGVLGAILVRVCGFFYIDRPF